MGGKDSKLSYLSYDEAVKRVSEAELKRLKDAFKRSSTIGGYMTKNVFLKEVLGDGVPMKLAEQIYSTFGGGTKGLTFKEVLCGLVLFTQGKQEEKYKFIFGLYADESNTFVDKQTMDSYVLASEGCVPHQLSELFRNADRVGYPDFRTWLIHNADVLSVSCWLLRARSSMSLSNDHETPTFYQTLAGVTHLDESDFIELEKRYWNLKNPSSSGKFDLATFISIVCPPFPKSVAEGLFSAFDENRDNHIDFKEMACGISACCRGPMIERQKFCFKIFDMDNDSLLSRDELIHMINIMLAVREENNSAEELAEDGLEEITPSDLAEQILKEHSSTDSTHISQAEYLVWTVSHPLPAHFLNLLFQVCHVVLGLKPQNREDEGQVIMGWLARAERLGLKVAQNWYIVNIAWWNAWRQYVTSQPLQSDGSGSNDKQSKVHNSIGNSLCPNLGRKYSNSSIASDDSEQVMKVTYSTLQPGDTRRAPNTSSLQNSPTKYATVPRASASVQNSPLRMNSASEYANNGLGRGRGTGGGGYPQNNSAQSTPQASPYASKRLLPGTRYTHSSSTFSKPGQIDNSPLVLSSTSVTTLTTEGGRLRKDRILSRGRDFEIVPEPVWKSLVAWYGGSPALPRIVIRPHPNAEPEVELYPLYVKLYRHQTQQQQQAQARQNHMTTFSGMMGGIGGVVVGGSGMGSTSQPQTPRRYWAYISCFSRKHTIAQVYDFIASRLRINRDDLRIWLMNDEANMKLLEDDGTTIEASGIKENDSILLEVRNKDQTWPEEISQLAKNKAVLEKGPTVSGATGLSNLGNTCFMNAALQCVSNTQALTVYFKGGLHLYELNRTNPLGMKGHIAQRYGDLVKDLWSGTNKSLAPLKFRWTIGKYAPRFNGFQQHDCQELLAFLLDGLHEDLNRVHVKPYVELKDSDGRCDEVVAKEAWENHLQRNKSIVVDLFHGQLKSQVACKECGHSSVRFDPFTYLSLPLPMDSCMHIEITVMTLDGSTPVKYGIRLNPDDKYRTVKKQLSSFSGIDPAEILLVEVFAAIIKSFPADNEKVKLPVLTNIFAYQVPKPPPIPTMSAEEEKGIVSTAVAIDNSGQGNTSVPNVNSGVKHNHNNNTISMGLNVIQRMPSTTDVLPQVNGNPKMHQSKSSTESHDSNQSPSHSPYSRARNIDSNRQPLLSNGPVVAQNPSNHTNSAGQNRIPNGSIPGGNFHSNNGNLPNGSASRSQSNNTQSFNSSSVNQNAIQSMGLNHAPSAGLSPAHSALNGSDESVQLPSGFVVAFHRKMMRMDVYFLSSQKSRPSLFGTPIVLPCDEQSNHEDLYRSVWVQVTRLVSALPPSHETSNAASNHAQDCDDSMGYEYPFTLKAVQQDGMTCAWCPWYRFCRGCKIECDLKSFDSSCSYIAIDWEPTALHLRYQSAQEKMTEDHESVKESRQEQTEPVNLDKCLEAFTREEELGEDELWYCSKCKKHQLAGKKLQIFKLPPVLIIHLKRFQLLNSKWVKSQKIVKFPFQNFDPSNYLVSRPAQNSTNQNPSSDVNHDNGDVDHANIGKEAEQNCDNGAVLNDHEECEPINGDVSRKGQSEKDLRETAVTPRQIELQNESFEVEDYTGVRYDLKSIACHTGILGGGHYVAYACNPSEKWYQYNDSSCKEVSEDNIDTNSAYILFYERQNVDYSKYMPDIHNKEPDIADIDDECENEIKKMCVIM